MLKNLRNQGFASIMEVIVTAVIFTIAAFGIFTATSMISPQGITSSKRLKAAYVGKQIIDELRGKVSASNWDTPGSPLYPTGTAQTNTIEVDGVNYVVSYIITEDPTTLLREITLNVEYPDG